MPRVRPARGSRSNGSHFPSAWLRSMRRAPLAKKRRAAIANSARAGLYTPRAFVSTAGLATRAGNSTSSIPAEREWTQAAPAARSHTDSRAARRIEQTKTASGAGAPAKSSRAAPRTNVTPAGAGSSTCRPGSRGEASTQTVTGRIAPDGTTELRSEGAAPRGEDVHGSSEPDPPPAREGRDADDLGGPRVPPLGGGCGGAPTAGPGRARYRHLRRPGLRRPRPVHHAGRAPRLGAAPAVAVPLPRSQRAHLRPPEGPRSRGLVPVPGGRQPGGGGDREDLLEAAVPLRPDAARAGRQRDPIRLGTALAGPAAGRLRLALRAGRACLAGAGRYPRALPGRALHPLRLRRRDAAL